MAGLEGNINLISSGIQYALFIVFTTVVFFFIDRTGRRPLLFYGALGMAACLFVVGGVLGSYGTPSPGGLNGNPNVTVSVSGHSSHVVIAFSYLLIIVYAITLAPVAWVYAAEVWSLETRATGMAMAAVANWLFNFALGLFIPPAFQNISWKTFIIFGVLCVGSAIQTFFTYPETAGKSLEEIEFLFSKEGPKPWHTRVGDSHLDHKIDLIREKQLRGEDVRANSVSHGNATTREIGEMGELKKEVS